MAAYLTRAQTAACFGVSENTIRRWDREGRLHGIRTIAGRRYDAEQVALMTGGSVTVPPLPAAGRSQPRVTVPDGFACDVRYQTLPDGTVRASCEPCQWACALEPGHSASDYERLEAMHAGRAA